MTDDTGLGRMPLFSAEVEAAHLGNGIHMLRFFANVCLVETEEGVVIFDTGLELNDPRIVDELRGITDGPVKYMIYGHSHADHAFGTRSILEDTQRGGQKRPTIISHENLPGRFDRYREMLPCQEHINRSQFGIPENVPDFVMTCTYPDETYRDRMS